MKKRVLIVLTLSMILLLCGCSLPKQSVEIKQVLPAEDGTVAVLFSDGTVNAAGNTQLSEAVENWSSVEQLYFQHDSDWINGEFSDESYILGLTKGGSVLSTSGDFSDWRNVKELHCTSHGIIGVTKEGRVLVDRAWTDESSKADLAGICDVDTLVHSDIQDIIACLKKDGSVQFVYEYGFSEPDIRWNGVKEIRDSGHAFYVIKKDGTVDGGLEESYPGLKDAVKIVDYCDWIFGVSADGRLLTHNGGNIFTNLGDWRVDVPGSPENWYTGEVDVSSYNQVEDIVVFGGLILLNKDGTVDSIGEYPSWDLSDWKDIKKVYCTADSNWNTTTLYGIHQDGTVILTRYNREKMVQTVIDAYCGWNLQDIYPGVDGVVGLTKDGELVGDGIYEGIDFSLF